MEHQQATKTAQGQQSPATTATAKPTLADQHPLLQFQEILGNQAVGRFLQAKLTINAPGDVYEQEADRVAEQVVSTPEAIVLRPSPLSVQKKCATCASGQGTCPNCAEEEQMVQTNPDLFGTATSTIMRQAEDTSEEEEPLQTKVETSRRDVSTTSRRDVSTHIHALPGRSGGSGLPASVRAFFEPRFGYDFSQVRVHTDANAAESARAVNALAYTVGRDVVFAPGQFAPETSSGRKLLAHELTHVVQQGKGAIKSVQTHPDLFIRDGLAVRHGDGDRSIPTYSGPVLHRMPAPGIQRLICDSLLAAREEARVNGVAAHLAIREDLVAQAGPNAMPIQAIPGASFSAFRTDCGDTPVPSVVSPLIIGGGAGTGFPDLAYRNGTSVELAEIKPAHYTCIPEAEQQVQNYVDKGNAGFNRPWRLLNNVSSFLRMAPGRFQPTSPISVGSEPVTVSWCEPGVIVYKAIRDQDPEIFVCGTSDQGRVDQFLDNVLGRAQAQVGRYIDQVIEPVITRAIQQMTIRQAINALYRVSREALREFVRRKLGGSAGFIFDQLPADEVVDRVAQWIEAQVGPQAEQLLRTLAQTVKTELLNRIRQHLQNSLRGFLQESLNALCAAALTVSAAQLLRQLMRDLPKYLIRIFGEVIEELVLELARAMAEALAMAVLIVAAAVVLVFAVIALWEVIAAIEIGELLVALGAAIARVLAQLAEGVLVPV